MLNISKCVNVNLQTYNRVIDNVTIYRALLFLRDTQVRYKQSMYTVGCLLAVQRTSNVY